jgi:hypothetical protein
MMGEKRAHTERETAEEKEETNYKVLKKLRKEEREQVVRMWQQRSNCRAYREGLLAFMVGERCKCERVRKR